MFGCFLLPASPGGEYALFLVLVSQSAKKKVMVGSQHWTRESGIRCRKLPQDSLRRRRKELDMTPTCRMTRFRSRETAFEKLVNTAIERARRVARKRRATRGKGRPKKVTELKGLTALIDGMAIEVAAIRKSNVAGRIFTSAWVIFHKGKELEARRIEDVDLRYTTFVSHQ